MFSGQHAERQGSKMARSLLNIVIMVLVVFGLSRLLNTFVFGAYEIPSGSMEDTIEVGDLVFSEKLSYYANEPQKGDIVTFADPLVSNRTLIKRVIATGGQTVDLQNGKVVVDGSDVVVQFLMLVDQLVDSLGQAVEHVDHEIGDSVGRFVRVGAQTVTQALQITDFLCEIAHVFPPCACVPRGRRF